MNHGWQHLTFEDREAILRGIEDGAVYGGPYHLEFDWVDKCNARCFFCNSAHTHDGASIPWDRALALLEEAAAGGLRSIRLSGGGEPTLHPHFTDLLRFLERRGIILDNLNTNGLLLNEAVCEALQGVRVADVRVSLNYPTAASYAEGMGLPERQFELVTRNIARLNAARRGNPNFGRLTLQYFIYRPTHALIRESYALARELGADWVSYRELSNIDPALQLTPTEVPEVLSQMREVLRQDWPVGIVECLLESLGLPEAVRRIYDELSAELGGAPPRAPQPFNTDNRYCYIGWYSMAILGSQAVYPCCYFFPNPALAALGSLERASLGETWRGETYTRFRREMRDFMLLQRPVPLFERRVKRITSFCASHTACPISSSMCDEAFYEEAERRLERVRRQPLTALWRLANRGGRFLERRLGLRKL